VFRKKNQRFHNLQPEQLFEELVQLKFVKFSNPFEVISLTNIQKAKDNTSSGIISNIFPNVWLLIKTMHNIVTFYKIID